MRFVLLCILLASRSMTSVYGKQPKEITNSIGMKLVLIPAGTFTMGSPAEEVGRIYDETQHEVTISMSYYFGAYEVTQDQYEKVMGDNPSKFKGAKNPVETVSWDDAVTFCKKLSELPEETEAGREYRLPMEAEWEYACRAGSKIRYRFGDSPILREETAWFGENSERKTHPVGEKKANRWGLYDMHGNVYEWCQDWYAPYPSGTTTNNQWPSGSSGRVIRGGSWAGGATFCRAAMRSAIDPSRRTSANGFRVAISLPAKQPESTSAK